MNAEFSYEPMVFGVAVDPDTSRRLQHAVMTRRRSRCEAERLLWEARAEDPACLPIYFALYNFYANARRLSDAVRASRLAIVEAARQGGFPSDWEKLNLGPSGGQQVDLYASEAGLYYLLSLKALAYIKLRQKQTAAATAILKHLMRLDREDRSGGSVIRALAESVSPTLAESENE